MILVVYMFLSMKQHINDIKQLKFLKLTNVGRWIEQFGFIIEDSKDKLK